MYLALYQNREFHRLDDDTTLKDFVAFASNLPIAKGTENPEDEIKKFLEDQTHEKIRGVSVAWNYTSKEKEVTAAIEADWKEREAVLAPPLPTAEEESQNPTPKQPPLGLVRRLLRKVDNLLDGLLWQSPTNPPPESGAAPAEGADAPLLDAAAPSGPSESEMVTMLNEMETSDVAFIVFETEEARDNAVENVTQKQGLDFKGSTIKLQKKFIEPESARFSGLAYGTNSSHRVKKMVKGAWITLFALLLWSTAFYLPFAYYMMSFSYSHGDEPSFFAGQVFNLLVVGGNQLMYFLAETISYYADFMFEDDREVAYNYVYVSACVLNCLLDLLITLWMGYKMMIGIGVHTADDRLLESLSSFHDVFESYPMQKVFGEQLYLYSFPSCFLYPFILEGLGTITLPYFVGKYIVLSHDDIQDRDAECSLQYFLVFNMGRYADIILNMVLCVMVFFCPGGFTLPMFIAFLFCHIGIYAYDHYRILRCTPNFYYANQDVDNFAQMQLIMPTATLAGCSIFRFSQMDKLSWLDGPILYVCCFLAFFGHCALHYVCLKFVIPKFKPEDHEASKLSYPDVAKLKPLTWFSANPVHCLRSKYIHKHNPPNIHCTYGKEHLQKANEEIGAYFEDATYGGAYKLKAEISTEQKEAKMEDKADKLEDDEDAP